MTRNAFCQLISQHLEFANGAILEDYPGLVKELFSGMNGIYALYKRGSRKRGGSPKLYYVGLAKDLSRRLKAHLRDRHKRMWDYFSVFIVTQRIREKELESLILHLVPTIKGNRVRGKLKNAENLGRQFERRLRAEQKREFFQMIGGRGENRKRAENRRREESAERGALFPYLKHFEMGKRQLAGNRNGKKYNALVLQDGSVRYAGKKYKTPSGAATAAVKRNCNGWTFWEYKKGPGRLMPLDHLRQ